ncbi:MAG: hypothetical protein ACRDSK_10090 [Actinophytocola sp.]|uniref:hypothetical protein n=1 Tax=Actinophytocola sp. TaxID=1872138 RepID=UPI003D6A77E4
MAKAENKLTEFRAQILKQRTVASAVPFAQAVDEWMQNSEVIVSTCDGYVNYIERYMRSTLGSVAVRKVDTRALERFYADLRRCRIRCDKKLFCGASRRENCRPSRRSSSKPSTAARY